MKTYELCIVSKEYRYIKVEAENENDAIDQAWGKVAAGFTCDTKVQGYDTDIYLESNERDLVWFDAGRCLDDE